ncbi:MAG: hypothetical protein IKV94_03530 [Clostridia bacterium]|nr:hypothetical protein [Clostridia bacterium]
MIKFIKNNSVKFISSMFIMLTILMVSTSVFAFSSFEVDESGIEGFTKEGIKEFLVSEGYSQYANGNYILFSTCNQFGAQSHTAVVVREDYADKISYIKENDTSSNCMVFYDSNNSFLKPYKISIYYSDGVYSSAFGEGSSANFYISDLTYFHYSDYDIYNKSGEIVYDTVSQKAKKIIYEINYAEDKKTATLHAEIKNTSEGDKLYYSTLGFSLTGKLINPIELNQSQLSIINLYKNDIIYLQAFDFYRRSYRYSSCRCY